ncbi:MAG: CHAD domain-containing protein, partial [Chloroflexota bacterium]|nr:CHAD domain-containing protein [Chloroflexota bacterium]
LAEFGAIQPEPPRQSTTVFYDTADLALARWGCLLRHRTREGWTVKLPDFGTGDGLERPEIAFDGPPGDPPRAALDLLVAFLRGRRVAPVARVRMLRRRIVIRDGQGATLLDIVDDRVSLDDAAPRTMRQLEIELRDESAGDLRDRVVGALRSAGAEAGDRRTKYAWALGDRVPPPEVLAPKITARSTAADVARYGLATSVIALIRRDADVRGGGDPEAVHQARVVVRRLRSDLRTFKGVLDAEWTRAMRTELDWLGEILGRVRDRQVLAARLREGRDVPDDADLRPVTGILDEEVARARVDLEDAMGSERYLGLVDELVAAAQNPRVHAGDGTAASVLRPAVDRSWKRLRKAVRTVRADPARHELHPVRIEAKRLRYTCEMLGSVFGKPAQRLASAAKELQDVLGEYQDAVVARDWLRDHSAADGASTAFALGELAALEVAIRDRAEAEWPAAWKALRRRRPTKWH